jgi:hypothetical protein
MTVEATSLRCDERPAGDNSTHHLVPRAGYMRCWYCGKTATEIEAQAAARATLTRWQGVVAVEGRVTSDGRLIEPTAIFWTDDPIPLMRTARGEPDWSMPLLGWTDRIERRPLPNGQVLVWATGPRTSEPLPDSLDLSATVTADEDGYAGSGLDYPLALVRGRLRQIVVGAGRVWDECVLEEVA